MQKKPLLKVIRFYGSTSIKNNDLSRIDLVDAKFESGKFVSISSQVNESYLELLQVLVTACVTNYKDLLLFPSQRLHWVNAVMTSRIINSSALPSKLSYVTFVLTVF